MVVSRQNGRQHDFSAAHERGRPIDTARLWVKCQGNLNYLGKPADRARKEYQLFADFESEVTFARREDLMPRLSQLVKRISEYREILFWLLLLGSWQFLVAPGGKNAVFGTTGTAVF